MGQSVSVADFVRSGTLGPLAIGCVGDVVSHLLGEPDDVGRVGKTTLQKYGGGRLEVSQQKGRVVLVALYIRRGTELAGNTKLVDDLPLDATDSREGFEQWLGAQGLRFAVEATGDSSFCVRVHGGPTAVFVDSKLDSLQIT